MAQSDLHLFCSHATKSGFLMSRSILYSLVYLLSCLQIVSVLGLLVNLIGIFAFHGAHGHSHGGGHGHSHGGHGHSHGGQGHPHEEQHIGHNTNMEGKYISRLGSLLLKVPYFFPIINP